MHSNMKTLLCQFNTRLQKRLYSKKVLAFPIDISISAIKRTLNAQKVPFDDGHTCFAIQCTICSRLNKLPDDCKLHINKMTGAFSCACNYAGQWNELRQSFDCQNTVPKNARDKQVLADLIELSIYLKGVYEKTVVVNTFSMKMQIEIAEKFGIKVDGPYYADRSPHIFDVLKVRINSDHSALYFPVRNVATRSTVGFIILSADQSTATQPQLLHLPLLGVLYARENPREKYNAGAIVVPSVKDMVVLVASSIKETIIVAPSGLGATLSQYVLPCFETFDKLILWLGEGGEAWDATRTFARKLGEKRCYIIRTSTQQSRIPLPQHLPTSVDIKNVLNSAQPLWHKSITNFAALRDDILSDLINIDKIQGVQWQRFPSLSRTLKGHRRGELTVLTGATGSGKTTFMSEYSLDLAMQGVITLWGSFEIRNARLARIMLQQHCGLKLNEHLNQFDQLADAFEQLPIYYMTFHGQQPVQIVMDAIEHAVYVYDIAHVIIDNVQFMLGLTGAGLTSMSSISSIPNDRFYRQDQVIAAFRTFATQRNCHVTLVIHPRKERDDERLTTASIFGGAKASQEADNVLIVQDTRLSSIRGKKYLEIAKNRYSGDLGVMPLDFNKVALSFAQKNRGKEEDIKRIPEDRRTRAKWPKTWVSSYFDVSDDDCSSSDD